MSTSRKRPARSSTGSTEEAKVRERIEAWAHAVRSHDLEGVVAHHAKDFVYFDVPPPTQVLGIRGYEGSWPPFFEYIGETGQFDLTELHITAGADVAFAHAILLVRGATEASPGRVRLTVGLRKVDGEWTIVHEHHSAPYERAP
ncbi:nuclear transport factor 2 family protein [Hyalangium gracile]|uniref:nuclear transport factor 2 family protein n=1 Tax=Hyalangium gracile TaxID=394092 RepID=UPI001CC9D4C8|nr:nuclear transport factor 2 family protein [Hyalangium gracile]